MVSDIAQSDWRAGAAETDITPAGKPYLCGYPYVSRDAEGVHDRLRASALCLDDGSMQILFVACDVLNLPNDLVATTRQRIEQTTNIPAAQVMLTATHTHSGPLTTHMVTNEADPLVPKPDPAYLARLEDGIVEAAALAQDRLRPASLGFATGDSSRLGGNRRDPAGPRIARLPVLVARALDSDEPIAVMVVCAMHPTVLHEDWRQISGDFPGLARLWLQEHVVGPRCPVVYHMGASGNQSPRHVVRANTIDEAHRLGKILGHEIQSAIERARPLLQTSLRVAQASAILPQRRFPSPREAQDRVDQAKQHRHQLRIQNATHAALRTAEVDWFGARKSLALARATEDGRLHEAIQARQPARVQIIAVGEHTFIGWPGEVFVEFALEVMQQHPHATIITLANGELHGYLVTSDAVITNAYEASHALFESPVSGETLVQTTTSLLAAIRPA